MSTFFSFFKEGREEVPIQLREGVVIDIERSGRGLIAHVELTEGAKPRQGFRFWIERNDQPKGSRCKLFLRHGANMPTVSRERDGFPVRIGTRVLLYNPEIGKAAFPVVSYNDYVAILEAKESKTINRLVQTRKRDHRWV